MTETYFGDLEQIYARDVYCRLRLGSTELLRHKDRMIFHAHCVNKNL